MLDVSSITINGAIGATPEGPIGISARLDTLAATVSDIGNLLEEIESGVVGPANNGAASIKPTGFNDRIDVIHSQISDLQAATRSILDRVDALRHRLSVNL